MEAYYAGWLSILPPVIAIVLALTTKEVFFSLMLGVLSGTCIYAVGTGAENIVMGTVETAFEIMAKKVDFNILVFCSLLGSLVYVVYLAGGSKAYGRWAARKITSKRSALLSTSGLGMTIFIDDYFSCLTVGTVMSPVTDSLKISSTIGPVDAGILPLLADTFSKKTGIAISMEKAGTGKTLKKAESGTFDLVMVHARKLEDAFVAAGFGVDRRDVMYNDFVILGPAGDPAGIKGMKSAAEAFATIAKAGVPFVSRGDKSGTHVKEMDIWQAAGIQPAGAWYEVYADGAKGNKATTLYTDKKQAYTLMDRATWLTLKDTVKVVPLVENDPIMLNLIAIIRVNPDKFPQVHKDAALKFADWLVGDEAQTIIRDFGKDKYGQPLFFPNSDQWNAKHGK